MSDPTVYRWTWDLRTGQTYAEPVTNVVEGTLAAPALPPPTSQRDPTDAAQPAQPPVEGETQWISFHEFAAEVLSGTGFAEWLDEQQRQHGICSEPTCHWPIATWCVVCGRKLCHDHLAEHRNMHARERERTEQAVANARVIDDPAAW